MFNIQPPTDLANPRNLSGAYFRSKVNGEWENICFEELPREEQLSIIKAKSQSKEWLENMILKLADTLVELGNFTNMSKILQILTELTIIDILAIKKINTKLNWFDSCTDILTSENIQQLLIDLDLGESPIFTKAKLDCNDYNNEAYGNDPDDFLIIEDNYYIRLDRNKPAKYGFIETGYKLQAIFLSNKWFSLQEKDGKPTPSLWNSGEDGKIQVLTELKGILENYLNN